MFTYSWGAQPSAHRPNAAHSAIASSLWSSPWGGKFGGRGMVSICPLYPCQIPKLPSPALPVATGPYPLSSTFGSGLGHVRFILLQGWFGGRPHLLSLWSWAMSPPLTGPPCGPSHVLFSFARPSHIPFPAGPGCGWVASLSPFPSAWSDGVQHACPGARSGPLAGSGLQMDRALPIWLTGGKRLNTSGL